MIKKQKGFTLVELFWVFYALLWVLGIIGWGMNVYKFCTADFEAPYKTEIIRVVGIPVFFIGGITGYMDIGEENKEND